jgi:hypothetical protein
MSDDVIAKTVIDGFNVELLEQDGSRSCHVSAGDYKYSSSLALLEATGYIEDIGSGEQMEIRERTIDKITRWAESNGY